jgi:hypothetical protein
LGTLVPVRSLAEKIQKKTLACLSAGTLQVYPGYAFCEFFLILELEF